MVQALEILSQWISRRLHVDVVSLGLTLLKDPFWGLCLELLYQVKNRQIFEGERCMVV